MLTNDKISNISNIDKDFFMQHTLFLSFMTFSLVKQGMLILDDIIEKRKVKLYRKNFQTLEHMLESWKKNLENDLPLSSTELKSFSSFRIDVLQ